MKKFVAISYLKKQKFCGLSKLVGDKIKVVLVVLVFITKFCIVNGVRVLSSLQVYLSQTKHDTIANTR
jgi:hypothetical protein